LRRWQPDAAPANDIPAQYEKESDHKTVPLPVITSLADKGSKKDRTLAASETINSDKAAIPVSSVPGDAESAAAISELEKEKKAPIPEAVTGASKPVGTSTVAANSKAANIEPPKKETAVFATPAAPVAAPAAPPKAAAPATPVAPATPAKSAVPAPVAKTPASSISKPSAQDKDVKKSKSGFFGKVRVVLCYCDSGCVHWWF
jgi:hypothetical protein